MIIRTTAFPRAGLIGNPSDGYFGRTISFAFTNFHAEVTLYETPELEILPNTRDHSRFRSIAALVNDVRLLGYYGGIRLLKATIKRFHDYCAEHAIPLHDRNFTIRYSSDIPHLVGLAGSSAIITACLRALMDFYDVRIPREHQPNLILSVEKSELAISAGLQDRVAQVYQGLVYMDFDRAIMERQGYGQYEELDPGLLPPLYIAYREDLSEGSEIFHNNLRERFERGEPEVLNAIEFWKSITAQLRECLLARDFRRVPGLIDSNFDQRAAICRLSEGNIRMVMAARAAGASAKFSGSGGAIVGTYEDEAMYERLVSRLDPLRIKVLKPVVAPSTGGVP
jgi:glucuronokinase